MRSANKIAADPFSLSLTRTSQLSTLDTYRVQERGQVCSMCQVSFGYWRWDFQLIGIGDRREHFVEHCSSAFAWRSFRVPNRNKAGTRGSAFLLRCQHENYILDWHQM
ncbi:Uncharacterised protein at_DN0199, partial [Pycnogonum litorale]